MKCKCVVQILYRKKKIIIKNKNLIDMLLDSDKSTNFNPRKKKIKVDTYVLYDTILRFVRCAPLYHAIHKYLRYENFLYTIITYRLSYDTDNFD